MFYLWLHFHPSSIEKSMYLALLGNHHHWDDAFEHKIKQCFMWNQLRCIIFCHATWNIWYHWMKHVLWSRHSDFFVGWELFERVANLECSRWHDHHSEIRLTPFIVNFIQQHDSYFELVAAPKAPNLQNSWVQDRVKALPQCIFRMWTNNGHTEKLRNRICLCCLHWKN